MKIWTNTIVNNEENFIWFSIMSVVDFVDHILIYDTGSTDKTVEIIKEIQKVKKNITLREEGVIDKSQFPKLRQKMLEESKCDWILVLDGDEIWWKESIKKVVEKIVKSGDKIEGIVVPMVVPVGDIYHIQDEKAGKYKLLGKQGHLSLRFINKKIPGLHVDLPYGKESYFDLDNKLIQERENIVYVDAPFLHTTHLKRSNARRNNDKFKFELGKIVSQDFKFPESLYSQYPSIVTSPWIKISGINLIKAKLLTPLRRVKRRLVK